MSVLMWLVCLLIAEVGDYCEEFDDQEYFSRVKLLPNQSRTIQLQIMEHYREHMYELEKWSTLLQCLLSYTASNVCDFKIVTLQIGQLFVNMGIITSTKAVMFRYVFLCEIFLNKKQLVCLLAWVFLKCFWSKKQLVQQ